MTSRATLQLASTSNVYPPLLARFQSGVPQSLRTDDEFGRQRVPFVQYSMQLETSSDGGKRKNKNKKKQKQKTQQTNQKRIHALVGESKKIQYFGFVKENEAEMDADDDVDHGGQRKKRKEDDNDPFATVPTGDEQFNYVVGVYDQKSGQVVMVPMERVFQLDKRIKGDTQSENGGGGGEGRQNTAEIRAKFMPSSLIRRNKKQSQYGYTTFKSISDVVKPMNRRVDDAAESMKVYLPLFNTKTDKPHQIYNLGEMLNFPVPENVVQIIHILATKKKVKKLGDHAYLIEMAQSFETIKNLLSMPTLPKLLKKADEEISSIQQEEEQEEEEGEDEEGEDEEEEDEEEEQVQKKKEDVPFRNPQTLTGTNLATAIYVLLNLFLTYRDKGMANIPFPTAEQIKRTFMEDSRFNPVMRTKLEFHMIILYLAIHNYVIPDISHLAHDLKRTTEELTMRFRQIGCHHVNKTENPLEMELPARNLSITGIRKRMGKRR